MSSKAKSQERATILVVDDEADIRTAVEMLLQYEGFEVWTARNGREALRRLEAESKAGNAPALILTDVKMPELDGLGLLSELLKKPDAPPVIVVSGHADVAMAVDAVKSGAVDFLEKPLDQSRLLVSVNNALQRSQLENENTALRRALNARWPLVGKSAAMLKLGDEIEKVGPASAPVLITGENGTGKEVVARNLHLASPRSAGPFVAVNCAAIPAELIESELFGHEKGSFTGAHERRVGHFEAADSGTLFLDEIGDMPLAAQAKVLRALESHEITRVGGTSSQRVDIRVVAATNADLAAAVDEKRFRMDLYYRLNVVPLHVPPLRERGDDVELLAEHFLAQIAERSGRRPFQLDAEALVLLRSLDYPGNVRQLRNLLEGAQIFADGDTVRKEDVERLLAGGPALASADASAEGLDAPFNASSFEDFKNQSEALFFRRKLEEYGGNVKRTAESLGMQRSHLYKKLDRYELR